ncbi:MAG: HupE/UreJ family protein [Burkholderiaceae bacterium]
MPIFAHAHSVRESMSLVGGFLHSLLGTVHLLAMLSVGIISALIGGRAIYWVLGAFVTCMLFGGTLGVLGIALPHVEFGIALSVLVLGAGITMPRQLPVWLTTFAVGLFGTLHGNAHGVEMPQAAVPVFYRLGFIISTTLIHMLGVGIGFIPFLHCRCLFSGATRAVIFTVKLYGR